MKTVKPMSNRKLKKLAKQQKKPQVSGKYKLIGPLDEATKLHLERLKSENEYIKELVNLFPVDHYFDKDTAEKIKEDTYKKTDKKLSKLKVKRMKGDELSNSTKSKRRKFDPSQQKTVSSLVLEEQKCSDSEDLDSTKTSLALAKRSNNDFEGSEQYQVMRSKLLEKIEDLKKKRMPTSQTYTDTKKFKRRLSKLKMKERRKQEKARLNGTGVGGTPNQRNDKLGEKTLSKGKQDCNSGSKINGDATSGVKLGFSKLDLVEGSVNKIGSKKRKGEPANRDYKGQLEKIQRKKEKMAKLEETDKDKAMLLKDKDRWNTALKKAEGIKVKDDEQLIKKSLKRKELQKKKSKKLWDDRSKTVRDDKNKKQDKRKRNLEKRSSAKKDKKIKTAKKRGRVLPGEV